MGQPLTAERLSSVLTRHPRCPRYWIAFSGGMDSSVLAHLGTALSRTDASFRFAAAHIHHGLHPAADQWAERVRECCRTLNLPLEIRHVDARPGPGESPEAAARRARYRCLETVLQPGEALLTAQHRDDQAETILLQLLRGAGIPGLAAMPEWTAFGPGFLGRPLLEFTRGELHDHAVRHGLRWIDDPGNLDLRFNRNYLRHEVLPRLRERWPGLTKALDRSARHCAEANLLLAELSQEWLCAVRHPVRPTLRIAPLASLSPPRQRLVLRQWLRSGGARMPPAVVIERILGEILQARGDRQPEVRWSEGMVRRYRGELYVLPPSPALDPGIEIPWHGDQPLPLPPANGTLSATMGPGPGIEPRCWKRDGIRVRYRRGGERLLLSDRAGTRQLKKLLHEAGLPPWIRERIPLIYIGGDLAAVADLWTASPFEGDPAGNNIRIHWERPPGLLAATGSGTDPPA